MLYDSSFYYKNALCSSIVTNKEIMSKISIPSTVFKYRSFDSIYTEASLQGLVYFQKPSLINANDPQDCRIFVDMDHFINTISIEKSNESEAKDIVDNWLRYVRDSCRVGCFSTICPASRDARYMWWQFASNGDGYCIEYEVSEEKIYPGSIIFLPVYYCYKKYDATAYIEKMFLYLKKLELQGLPPKLDERFVAEGYNHVLFKTQGYIREKEWRSIIVSETHRDYFDRGEGLKDLSSSVKKIYIHSGKIKEKSNIALVNKYAVELGVECIDIIS